MTNRNGDDKLGSFYMGRGRPVPEPKRILPRGALTIIVVLAFIAIVWYAYPQGAEKYTNVDVPVVKADTQSYTAQPDDPGGMEVQHQDSTVFDPIENKTEANTENLLAPAEEPVDRSSIGLAAEKPVLNLEPEMNTTAAAVITESVQASAEPQTEQNPAEKTPIASPDAQAAPKVVVAEKALEKPVVESGNAYIQLGAYRTVDSAKSDWMKLQKKFPDSLASLTMKTERVDIAGKGIFYRLQAGKVTPEHAKKICDVLKAAKAGGCILVQPK